MKIWILTFLLAIPATLMARDDRKLEKDHPCGTILKFYSLDSGLELYKMLRTLRGNEPDYILSAIDHLLQKWGNQASLEEVVYTQGGMTHQLIDLLNALSPEKYPNLWMFLANTKARHRTIQNVEKAWESIPYYDSEKQEEALETLSNLGIFRSLVLYREQGLKGEELFKAVIQSMTSENYHVLRKTADALQLLKDWIANLEVTAEIAFDNAS